MYQFSEDLIALQQRNNQFLQQQLAQLDSSPAPLADAMRYSLLLGGKRIRPFLVYATGRMLGVDLAKLDHIAGAIECIHCYSLIHDDLLLLTKQPQFLPEMHYKVMLLSC